MHTAFSASILCALMLFQNTVLAQTGSLTGTVQFSADDQRIAQVLIPSFGLASTTDETNTFTISNILQGNHKLLVRALGYAPYETVVSIESGGNTRIAVVLEPDPLLLSQAVVSATRNEVSASNAPLNVSRIDASTFEQVQAISVAEGLYFSPGLRVENNCQNCGFTQIRMNGLDGAYSQVLINSRPIFSALAGVYGLELLPANMVDRVEIIRGGGSALYGGNAIAGTVNIITKAPTENGFNLSYNHGFTNLETPDRTATVNGTLVNEDGTAGASIYGFNRERAPWDANGDGISELVQLSNTTVGFHAFYRPTERSRIELNGYTLNEFRRGGSDFDRVAHQAELTEQLQHRILGTGLTVEQFTRNYRHKFTGYLSMQIVDRASYYGAGGRIIDDPDAVDDGDLIALNSYGQSDDITLVGGLQHTAELTQRMTLTSGSEWQFNNLDDRMPGYGRLIEQQVSTLGLFSQLEFKPVNRLTLLAGGRFDYLSVNGRYETGFTPLEQNRILPVWVPRLAAMAQISDQLRLRASYAQGYRGPQAFDEDLHINTVGGDALFIRLSDDLETERSESYTASVNYSRTSGTHQVNLVAEGFYTLLNNPFILADQEDLDNGIAIITKRNASGANVRGINLEANAAWNRRWTIRSGMTFQQGNYDQEEVIWEDEDLGETTSTKVLLRMPRSNGYLAASYTSIAGFTGSLSAVYTGSMRVPHVIDPETEFTVIRTTPAFFEINVRLSHAFVSQKNGRLELFTGVHNLLNSYQNDFDIGPERDAGYIYGPMRPRTIFFGFSYGF